MASGAEDMDRQIDQWAAKVHAKAQKYKALTTEMESITGSAESASGAVRVTVNRAGILTDLSITDDIRTMRGGQLAGEIMGAIRSAQSTLGAQVVAMMQDKVPEDGASIDAVADSYAKQFAQPDEDEPAEQPPASRPYDDGDDEFNSSVFE